MTDQSTIERAAYERGVSDAAEKLRSQGYGTAVRQILAMVPEGEGCN